MLFGDTVFVYSPFGLMWTNALKYFTPCDLCGAAQSRGARAERRYDIALNFDFVVNIQMLRGVTTGNLNMRRMHSKMTLQKT